MESSVNINTIKEIIDTLIQAKEEDAIKASLENFVREASLLYTFNALNSSGVIPSLWTKLFECMKIKQLNVELLCLEALRILTRDNTQFQCVLTKDRVNVLLQYANILTDNDVLVDTDDRTVAALKCLYNVIYNSREGLQILIDQRCVERILYRAENSDSKLMSQIKLFDMKVLFLVSALCKDVRESMKEKHGIKHLIKKLEYVQDSTTATLSTPEANVFCEILKILFNLSLTISEDEEDQTSCMNLVQLLGRLLIITVLNDQTKIELHNNIVNLLTNMPYSSYKGLIASIDQDDLLQDVYVYDNYNVTAVHHLLGFLENRLLKTPAKIEELAPILTILLRAATSVKVIRKYLRLKILPPLRDVHNRPEEGNSLRNQLCRLLTNPSTLSDLAAGLLFVLCKENVSRLIKHTGYGNAAGLLAQKGLLAGGSSSTLYSSESEDSDTEEYKKYKDNINPVVGCYEPPHANHLENMSEEQKEHEAMQLVNLMDKLSRKSIVKPCKVGADGKLQPVEHILELQETLPIQLQKKN